MRDNHLAEKSMSHPPSPFEVWLTDPLHLFVFFVAMWLTMSYLVGWLTGWMTLAGKFRAQAGFDGETWRFRTAYMRFRTHYGTCSTIGSSRSGLYLSIFPLLRLGHPPLFIPWSEITVMRGESGILFKQRKLLLGRAEQIPLRVSSALAGELKSAAGVGWPVEPLGV